jgi:hypothetical protein
MTSAGLLFCCSWSPVVSWEAESCQGRLLRFCRLVLHGEAGSGMHSHLREAGLTWLWWIQGAITATLTVVGVVEKITTRGVLQWGFNGWIFYLFIFTQCLFFFNWVELLWQQYTVSVYLQENLLLKKVKTTIFKYQRPCLESVNIVILSLFK